MRLGFVLILLVVLSCQDQKKPPEIPVAEPKHAEIIPDYNTDEWDEITTAKSGIQLDLRYSTEDNFTDQIIYSCPRCFVRPELGKKLRRIQKDIKNRYGYGLILYDCYRPRPAQEKLWQIVPNPTYVTNPKKGSMHNRGLAIDVGLIGKNGELLDMGTDFDFFGKEAHHTFQGHKETVLKHRRFLKKLMEMHGFQSIRTEWWHYSLKNVKAHISDWQWSCD